MTPKLLLLGIAGFFFVILCVGTFMGVMYGHGRFMDTADLKAFNKTFNRFSTFDKQVTSFSGSVTTNTSTSQANDIGLISSLVGQGWNSLIFLANGFKFTSDIFAGLNLIYHVPLFVAGVAGVVVSLIIVFGILALVFNSGGGGEG